ncbi:MAG: hypothetical protein Q9203_002336 [Teloschistes exilis]
MSETQELTFKDVAGHNSKKDLYVVIHDKVYDATKFIDEHPYVFTLLHLSLSLLPVRRPNSKSPASIPLLSASTLVNQLYPSHRLLPDPPDATALEEAKDTKLTNPSLLHSGGEEVLLDVGGQDATEAFEDVGHSDEARTILDGLEKGPLKRMPGDPAGYHESPKHFSSQPSSSSSGGGAGMGVMFYAILLVGAGLAYGAFQYLSASGGKEAGGKA